MSTRCTCLQRALLWAPLGLALVIAGCTFDSKTPDAGADPGEVHQGFGPEGEHGERRITFLSTASCGKDAHGNHVVYSSCRGIYLVDLENETERRLVGPFIEKLSSGGGSYPRIWKNKIAYQAGATEEGGVGPVGVAVYDFAAEQGVWLPGEKDKLFPKIFEQRVVWQDHRYQDMTDQDPSVRHNSEVFLYDLETGEEKRVTDADYHQLAPDIYGDHVVWFDERDIAQRDVWMYDIATGEQTNISDHPADQLTPSIWQDKVVWADLRNGTGNTKYTYQNLDIYLYDISTGQLRQITDDPADQEHPYIFGRYITWNDMRNGSRPVGGGAPSGADVYLYDLETNEEKRVTWHEANDGAGEIAGGNIVWYSLRDGKPALYMKPLDAL